jgi:hypothetical protein
MARSGLRNAVALSVLAALIALVLRSLRSAPLPTAAVPAGGSAPSTTGTGAPAVEPAPVATPLPGIDGPDPLVVDGVPGTGAAAADDAADWVEVGDGPAPATHPVKAKLASGIYHLPGMLNYERTRPDRWYRSAEAAEADGLRRAKR